MHGRQLFILLLALLFLLGCKPNTDYKLLPAFDAKGQLNAVIEIAAGSNKKIEFDPTEKKFKTDKRDGKERTIAFLPYPANYGFIPSTLSDQTKGGDGDPVDILVVCESQKTGTVMQVIPIAMLKLIDNGEEDFKVLAVPADPALNSLGLTTYQELLLKKPNVLKMIETWFLSYDSEPAKSEGWADQKETMAYIKANFK